MIILGVDPGASGAIARVEWDDGQTMVEVVDMPVGEILVGKTKRTRISPELLAFTLRELMPVDCAYVEEVASMPRQGLSSTFTFGQAHGMILGALAAFGVRVVRIRPQAWQNAAKAKGDPRPRAMELYPITTGELKLKKHDGRADAILIAHAGHLLEN